MADVKVNGGNNRQFDLLAVNLKKADEYHIEVSVTHAETWCPNIKKLREIFDTKFRGIPPRRKGRNTDYAKSKNYLTQINKTYEIAGLHHEKIRRVYCC